MTDLNTKLILQAHDAIFERGPRKLGWYRVEIASVHDRQRHYVDVEGFDEFEATSEALAQNRHASSAKVVRRYYDGEALLGNW